MKRWVFRIVLLVLFGAIINVAVAWGCAVFIPLESRGTNTSPTFYTNPPYSFDRAEQYKATIWKRCGAQRMRISFDASYKNVDNHQSLGEITPNWASSFLDVPEMRGRMRTIEDDVFSHYSIIDQGGWPMLSMWGGAKIPFAGITITRNGAQLQFVPEHYYSIDLRWTEVADDPRLLPLHPRWTGFWINTVLYAFGLSLLLALLSVRRWLRIKRALCPKCAYPIGASDTCTECGRPVKRKS